MFLIQIDVQAIQIAKITFSVYARGWVYAVIIALLNL